MITILADWKKEGAYVGLEYRLQLGGYYGCPYILDKATGQVTQKQDVSHAAVFWVGEHGVKLKMLLDKQELEEAYQGFKDALAIYRMVKKYNTFPMDEGRYDNPLKRGEKLISVTQVLKYAIGKDGLLQWHYDSGLEAGLQVANSTEFSELDVINALEARAKLNAKTITTKDEAAQAWVKIKERIHEEGWSAIAKRDGAGNIGSLIHKNVMFYLQGKNVDLTNAPPWLSNTMADFAVWSNRYKLNPLHIETTVFNPDLEYAGTLDCLGEASDGLIKQREGE